MEEKKDNKAMDDGQLIKRYIQGDAECFNILYSRYKRQMYSYLNRLLPGQPQVADDIFQQTWIKIIHCLPQYKNRQRFLAWAVRIAHNTAIDHFRKNKYENKDKDPEEQIRNHYRENQEPWRDMNISELTKVLEKALGLLQPELREVFLLRQDEMSFKEIAEIQECSLNTALGRMQYAVKNLRKILYAELGKGELS